MNNNHEPDSSIHCLHCLSIQGHWGQLQLTYCEGGVHPGQGRHSLVYRWADT